MEIIKAVSKAIADTIENITEKNRTAAKVNRLRLVMRNEADIMTRAYVNLGKYYYENMRDTEIEDNKKLCEIIEKSGQRMKKAQSIYSEIMAEQAQDVYDEVDEDNDDDELTIRCAYDDAESSVEAVIKKDEEAQAAKVSVIKTDEDGAFTTKIEYNE